MSRDDTRKDDPSNDDPSNDDPSNDPLDPPTKGRHRVRLPGFLVEDTIGLGDVITRVTYAVGISPCGGCKRRAAALNRWVAFTRRPR
jgi:hypothetical protein